jgi:hypothetical protein
LRLRFQMIKLNKLISSTGFLFLLLFFSNSAQAGFLDFFFDDILDDIFGIEGHTTATFDFNGTFFMYDSAGGLVAPPDNNLVGDMTMDIITMGGSANMSSTTPFFGSNWTAHDIKFSSHIDLFGEMPVVAHGSMLFDWGSGVKDLEIDFAMNMDFVWGDLWGGDINFDITSIDTDGDGIPGIAMTDGPFAGFTPAFTGLAHFSDLDLFDDVIDNPNIFHERIEPNPVPVPAAFWLFGSGIFSVFSLAFRKQKAEAGLVVTSNA